MEFLEQDREKSEHFKVRGAQKKDQEKNEEGIVRESRKIKQWRLNHVK